MSKQKIIQFRFFSENNYPHTLIFDFNLPSNITIQNLYSGDIFNNYFPIKLLRITTLPGVKFKLNANSSFFTIGSSGIYEVTNIYNNLIFDQKSLEYLDKNPDGFLIIDIVYEGD